MFGLLNSNLSSDISGKANKDWTLVTRGTRAVTDDILVYDIPDNINTIANEYMVYVGFSNNSQIYGGTSLVICQHISHPCFVDILRSESIRYTVYVFLNFRAFNVLKQFIFNCVQYDSSKQELAYALFYR